MEEFRRSFEYTEEKRGLILLFVIMLITVDLFRAPLYIFPVNDHFKQISALSFAFMAISCFFVILNLVTAFTCYRLQKNMVIISKVYLIVRALFMTSCIIILYVYGINENVRDTNKLLYTGLIVPLAYEAVFTIGWYVYFVKSKRCKEITNKLA